MELIESAIPVGQSLPFVGKSHLVARVAFANGGYLRVE